MDAETIGLRQWRTDSEREAVVRIGIVLAEDALTGIEMQIPDAEYELASADQANRLLRDAKVTAQVSGGGRLVDVHDEIPQRAESWTISPKSSRAAQRH